MQEKICQSCAMPMRPEDYGTNQDGTPNDRHCRYCYQNGAYTADISMDEMIEACVPHVVQANPGTDAAQARAQMRTLFPTLERWR